MNLRLLIEWYSLINNSDFSSVFILLKWCVLCYALIWIHGVVTQISSSKTFELSEVAEDEFLNVDLSLIFSFELLPEKRVLGV